MEDAKKKKWIREIRQWGILLAVGLVLYLTGYHTEVIGRLQELILKTGILRPHLMETPEKVGTDFFMENLDGTRIRLSQLKGKVVFINLWATWCPPCVAELPDMEKLYKSNESDDLVFIFLNIDRDTQKARDFIKRKGLDLPVFIPASPLPPSFSSKVIPSTYLIDRNGYIVMERRGMAKYSGRHFRRILKAVMEKE